MKHLTMYKVEKHTITSEFKWNVYSGDRNNTTSQKEIIGYYNTPEEAENKVFELTGERIKWLSKAYFRKQVECSEKISFKELYDSKARDDLLQYEICVTKRMRRNNSTYHRVTYRDNGQDETIGMAEWYEIKPQIFSWSEERPG